MGARRARPRPGHPRPRPRPLPTSPPLPQGWGRPLPGPRGLPGFPREGTDRATERCQERKARFIGNLGSREESVGAELAESAVQVVVGPRTVGGGRQVPGESCGSEKGKRPESPPGPLPQPWLRSPLVGSWALQSLMSRNRCFWWSTRREIWRSFSWSSALA